MCSFDSCENVADTKGMCQPHYLQQWNGQALKPLQDFGGTKACAFPECRYRIRGRGYCNGHYKQLMRGVELHPLRPGSGSSANIVKTRIFKVCVSPDCQKPRMGTQLLCRNDYNRATKFSLTAVQYISLPRHCESCGSEERLAIDHDHMCCPGKSSCGNCIRGILCLHCNTALGLLRDDPAKISSLLNYMQTNN